MHNAYFVFSSGLLRMLREDCDLMKAKEPGQGDTKRSAISALADCMCIGYLYWDISTIIKPLTRVTPMQNCI